MKKLLILFSLSLPAFVQGQDTLTLDTCIAMAFRQFQYAGQVSAYKDSRELAERNANKTWFPKMILDGTFTYQNEQISIPIDAPIPDFNVPEAPKYSNKLLVNFSQNIYDGSLAANKKKLEQSKYDLKEKEVETQKLKIKSQVVSIFMGIKLSEENLRILHTQKRTVQDNLDVLKKAAQYGAVTKLNLKILEAETLQIDQYISEAEHSRSSLLTALSELTGTDISPEMELVLPEPEVVFDHNLEQRPEIILMNARMKNLELQKKMLNVKRNPKLGLFGAAGAGYPGYNVFLNEIRPMAMVGLKLNWEIWDWNLVRNQKKILTLDQQVVQHEQERARLQYRVELNQQQEEINKMQDLLNKDADMVDLRTEISGIKASQLKNGAVTSTEYLTELNKEEEARLNQKIHELKMILAKLNYLTIQGK